MIDVIKPLIKRFLPFAQERMGFKDPPKLFMRTDEANAQNPLGKTAFYDPGAKSVTLYISGRHPKDVMRSLSHELVHHTQNCNGEFENVGEMGEGYAQNDTHLREMERQAYEIGNLCFRDWEDSIKHTIYFEHLQKGVEKIMSTKDWKNGEINTLLTEKWGFSFDLDRLNEEAGPGGVLEPGEAEKEESKGKKGKKPYVAEREEEGNVKNEDCPPMGGEDVVVMGSAEGEMDGGEPVDAASHAVELVDELRDVISELVGGEEGEEEMAVDVQEHLRTSLKSILETGSKRKGESMGDKGKDKKDPKAKDYSRGGDREGDEDAKGEKDYESTKKGDKKKGGGTAYKKKEGSPGARTPLRGRMAGITEDSGEEEGEHYEDSAMHDEDHIKAIEHHLNALKRDRDYDEEHIEEGGLAHRRGTVKDPRNKRPKASSLGESQLRAFIRKALKKSLANK